jgi:hypothetical protein
LSFRAVTVYVAPRRKFCMKPLPLMVLTCGLMAASAAAASDMTYAKADATVLTETNVGKPYWSLTAQCAGIFGAASNHETDLGRSKTADTFQRASDALLDDAVARLQADRGVDRDTALDTAAPELNYGRQIALQKINVDGLGPESGWNMLSSACDDISKAYHRHAR